MDFARQQRDPKKHLIGLTAVVLLHLIIIYGLMTGLARKAVEVIKKPISATVVEEIKKPPPPPPPPPPKTVAPGELAGAAVRLMEKHGIMALPVLDDANKVVGMVHLHDLMKAGA